MRSRDALVFRQGELHVSMLCRGCLSRLGASHNAFMLRYTRLGGQASNRYVAVLVTATDAI